MLVALFLLALAMIVTGVASAIFGAPIVQLERGHTMIIAGSGVASAGAVLLGLTFLCYRLKRIQREIRRLGDRMTRQVGVLTSQPAAALAGGGAAAGEPDIRQAPLAPETAGSEPPSGPSRPDREPKRQAEPPVMEAEPDASPELPAKPTPEPTVVGKYASGGNSYVMYSDGSIHAETPSGHHRFSSLDDLKAFVAAGGERRV